MTKDDLEKIISEFAAEIRPNVQSILSRPATTQDYYGSWMHIISGAADPTTKKLYAIALLEAGAPRAGVAAALRILGLT